jgi:type III secretion protein V
MQEVKNMLDNIEKTHPALVEAVVPKIVSLYQLTEILKRLLQEDISIRDMKRILEALAQYGRVEKDTVMLTEYVRCELKRYITYKYTKGNNSLYVYLLEPQIEEIILNSIEHSSTGSYLSIDPQISMQIFNGIREAIKYKSDKSLTQPVILTNMEIRRYVKKLIELEFPQFAVLSYQELSKMYSVSLSL